MGAEAWAKERKALAEEFEQKTHSEIGLRVRAEALPLGECHRQRRKAKRLVDKRKNVVMKVEKRLSRVSSLHPIW